MAMKEKEKLIVTGLTVLLVTLWLGFIFHRSPRFAGSVLGGILAISGSILMLFPLAYVFIKRIKRLKKWTTQFVSMRTLLSLHIYAGIVGPILVLLHTGHKFNSLLGIVLTGLTIIVVISGFVGRYLMQQLSAGIREKKAMLSGLKTSWQEQAIAFQQHSERAELLRPFTGFFGRVVGSLFVRETANRSSIAGSQIEANPFAAIRISESIADVEFAIRTHEKIKAWFGKWLKLHIVLSSVLYLLLALHVWAGIHFGLRWFPPSATDYFRTIGQPELSSAADRFGSFSPSINAQAEFNRRFAKLFKETWRSPARINGISTTVFDYAEWARQIRQPDSDLSLAVQALKNIDVRGTGFDVDDIGKAFWINVYNFTAMKLAAEHYPIDSITSLKINADGNPWGEKAITVGQREYSMREIEVKMLLDRFDDPRIVFAVSCAAVSCPDRTADIFNGPKIDSQLDTMIATLFQNPQKGLAIDRDTKTLTLSWIVKADQRLFREEEGNGNLDFVIRYAAPDIADWIETNREEIQIEFFVHDWSLNDVALVDEEGN